MALADDLVRLRRMTAEPTITTYSDAALTAMLNAHRLPDVDGLLPLDEDWSPTYDLSATAADVWSEKAAALAAGYDFSADGATFTRSQALQQAQAMERKYRSQRAARGMALRSTYEEDTTWLVE